jgi:hypothetical protein
VGAFAFADSRLRCNAPSAVKTRVAAFEQRVGTPQTKIFFYMTYFSIIIDITTVLILIGARPLHL